MLFDLGDFEEALSYSENSLTTSNRADDACKSLAKALEFYAKARNEKERLTTQRETAALAC